MESQADDAYTEFNREIMVRLNAHTAILYAMLKVIRPEDLERIGEILEEQVEQGGSAGLDAESLNLALDIISLAAEESSPDNAKKP